MAVRNPSVNIKWVGNWDKNDTLKWVKTLQDMHRFEGDSTHQANIMYQIIKQKNLTGKHLEKCDTTQSIKKLFGHKIQPKTAKMLLENLNLERTMYQKRELSKNIIKKGKWKPRVDEKIRVVDIRYKPLRSYDATIKKVAQDKILITYDGYNNSAGQWLKRQEWATRITILENNYQSQPNQQTQHKFHVGQKIECMDGNNQKWYYATIKKVESERVLVRWENPKWQSSKYDQWIVKAHYDIRLRPRRQLQNNSQQSFLAKAMSAIMGDTGDNGTGALPPSNVTHEQQEYIQVQAVENDDIQVRNDGEFQVGQRIECLDGNNQKWYYARIKKVESNRVLVQWSNPRWQSAKYDQWIIKAHYDIRIRTRRSENNNNNNDQPAPSYTQVMNEDSGGQQIAGYVYKHIDEWSTQE
eukprot:508721_1